MILQKTGISNSLSTICWAYENLVQLNAFQNSPKKAKSAHPTRVLACELYNHPPVPGARERNGAVVPGLGELALHPRHLHPQQPRPILQLLLTLTYKSYSF